MRILRQWRISFNAPVILTFVLVSLATTALQNGFSQITASFSAPSSVQLFSPYYYLGLFLHPLAHNGWPHWFGNATFLLLLGPLMEEKYGSKRLLLLIVVTAVITGLLNSLFFDRGLIGASGIVFMLIILASFVNVQEKQIPLSFLFVVLIFIGQELLQIFRSDNISRFGHILGGCCGAAFGFYLNQIAPRKTTLV